MIVATLGSRFGVRTLADVDVVTAKMVTSMAAILLIFMQISGLWDHPYKQPIVHT